MRTWAYLTVLGLGLVLALPLVGGCGSGNGNVDAGDDARHLLDGTVEAALPIDAYFLPDAGPAVGTQLSANGGWTLQVSQDSRWVVFADFTETGGMPTSHARVAPIPQGVGDTRAEAVFANGTVVREFDARFFYNVAVAVTDYDMNSVFGTVQVWKEGMANPDTLSSNTLPFVAISTDGAKVAYLKNYSGAAYDVNVRDVANAGGAGTTAIPHISASTSCGIGGIFASPTLLITVNCQPTAGIRRHLYRTDVSATPVVTALSSDTETASDFLLTTNDGYTPNGRLAAYVTATGALNVVSLTATGTITPLSIETTGVPPATNNHSSLGGFHTNTDNTSDLYYFDTNGNLIKATVAAGGANLVGKTKLVDVTVMGMAPVRGWALSSSTSSPFSFDAAHAMIYRDHDATGDFGSMDLVTVGTMQRIALNSDMNGYPGDDAYSTAGTYVFWYDNVELDTGGIGRIHSRKFDGSSAFVLSENGFFVRDTAVDTIAALMGNTIQVPDGMKPKYGDLFKVDLTNNMQKRLTDQITYIDTVPANRDKVVYGRRDGIWLVDNFSTR